MSKLEKIDRELEKAVRSLKLTPAELAAFFSNPAITASGQLGPKPEKEKEDTDHEE